MSPRVYRNLDEIFAGELVDLVEIAVDPRRHLTSEILLTMPLLTIKLLRPN